MFSFLMMLLHQKENRLHPPVETCHSKSTAEFIKRVTPEFSLSTFFHFSLYQDSTKWVCTTRDVSGTKTSGRNGKMSKGQNSGATRFLYATCCF
jgi:hypothetical protein